jgi:hypothetical protein
MLRQRYGMPAIILAILVLVYFIEVPRGANERNHLEIKGGPATEIKSVAPT